MSSPILFPVHLIKKKSSEINENEGLESQGRQGVSGQAGSRWCSKQVAGPFDEVRGLDSPFACDVADVSHELPIERHLAQAQHTKHQRCMQNENEMEKNLHCGWKQGSTSAGESYITFLGSKRGSQGSSHDA